MRAKRFFWRLCEVSNNCNWPRVVVVVVMMSGLF